ncbi:MAG: aryl-sulfate sulfotransferase [Terriglobia bacterium]
MKRRLGQLVYVLGMSLAGSMLMAGCRGGELVQPADAVPGVHPTTNPLVATYTISPPPGSVSVYVEFGTDTEYGFETSKTATPSGGGYVYILVAGMKPVTTYHMRAVAVLTDGTLQYDSDHTFTTGVVDPARVPQVQVNVTPGLSPAPGTELACLTPGSSNQFTVAAFDPQGNLVWYYDYSPAVLGVPQPVKLLPNGHLLLVLGGDSAPSTILEIDLTGKVYRQVTLDEINQSLANQGSTISVTNFNHDILQLPNGHLIILASNNQNYANLPGYPGQTTVTGNALVDLDPDNKVVWAWSAFDHLDVNRHPMSFPDWTHANALAYSQDDGNLLLSLRHQNWVLKLDYGNGSGTGDILWKLGYQGDFTLNSDNPADWFYAQHDTTFFSPNTTGDFLLGVYDNGDDRLLVTCGTPGGQPCYTRATIFEVNESNMTASVNWADSPLSYSSWGGVVQLLPSGDIYVDLNAPVTNPNGALVFEVTQSQTPQLVWQMGINGQNAYRTIHLPSLYPGVQW